MSEFKRTNSGLNNLNLFHNVDFTLYLEGGRISYSLEQVYNGEFSAETEDIIFWRGIFDKFQPSTTIKFKSIGSKAILKEIANDIVNGSLTTVLVAMDNEFDDILNRRIEHPKVFYTFGYAWENDVWGKGVVKRVIEEVSAVKIETNDIEANFAEFLEKIKVAVFADGYLFKSEMSFFPRPTGYLFCVDCDPVDLPGIKYAEIERKIVNKGITVRKAKLFGTKHALDAHRYCYGHLLADYCCQLVVHYIRKRHALSNLSRDIIYRMGIKKFHDHYLQSGRVFEYYRSQFIAKGIIGSAA